MKYTAVIIVLIAMGAAGCSDSESDQTESPEETSAEAVAAEAKRILEAAAQNEAPKSVKPPGFFGGGSARGRRKDDPEDQDIDPLDSVAGPPEPTTQPELVKRPPPKPVTPDERAAKQVKLAKLYIANAAAAPNPAGRKFLNDKAVTILKEVISTRPQAPAATEAARLLAGIEAAK